jgi:hypothetical protein
MLTAVNNRQLDIAETIRKTFQSLENLRNEINPIRVLHEAVTSTNISKTGPILPLLSPLDPNDAARVKKCSEELSKSDA